MERSWRQVELVEVVPSRGGFTRGVSEMPRQSIANRGDDGFKPHELHPLDHIRPLPVRLFYIKRGSSHIPDSYLCLNLFDPTIRLVYVTQLSP